MCSTPCLGACVSEEATPLRMVTGVVPVTTSPMLKLEQRSMIYQDKECKNGNNLSSLNIYVFFCVLFVGSAGGFIYMLSRVLAIVIGINFFLR